VHNAVTYFTMYSYNFCWPVRTLRVRQTTGGWQQRTPAMAAGLADHVWSLTEWLTFPVVQLREDTITILRIRQNCCHNVHFLLICLIIALWYRPTNARTFCCRKARAALS